MSNVKRADLVAYKRANGQKRECTKRSSWQAHSRTYKGASWVEAKLN